MTSTVVAALPVNGDQSQWTESEKALVEAAGLVTGNGQNRRLAPRPVVEAFLLHARRTGLDPIARQIYCIERGGKWGTQVSIDGARLVAERTGQYRGQTPTQWTDDGVTWVDVWLPKTPPAAARVGVHREGFTEPLYAVATFDAYNANSPIWKKMPALMLGKCAEMLALRKAFPQDLSGLYSTEEMDQAGGPREVVKQAERRAPEELVAAVVEPGDYEDQGIREQSPITPPSITKDWAGLAKAATSVETLTGLANDADQLGELGLLVDGERSVIDVLRARKAVLEAQVTPPLVDVPAKATGKRQWVREARGKKTRVEVQELHQEAIATGAPVGVIDELEAIANTLPDPEAKAPEVSTGWAVAQIPTDAGWSEPSDADAPPVDDEPAVFDPSIGGES